MPKLPEALIDSLRGLPGFDEQSFRDVHDAEKRITSVRINPRKSFDITSAFPGAKKIPWTNSGYYLPERPLFAHDPLFHAGCYYVQDASSMFLEQALANHADLETNLTVLDLCASPGGKSTHLQSLISAQSLLVSNEVIKTRIGRLKENIMKWGAANVVVTNNDAKDFRKIPDFFDVIVADAPCSGSGLFRKDPEAISEWSDDAVALCAARQQRILEDVMPALKEGGLLIYSTCSYSPAENEYVADEISVEYALSSLRIPVPAGSGIEEVQTPAGAFCYRFYPNKVEGEGFFLAAFRKGSGRAESVASTVDKFDKKDTGILSALKQPADFLPVGVGDIFIAIPKAPADRFEAVRAALYVRYAGFEIGSLAGKDLIPAHALALSEEYAETFTGISLSREEALAYLRKTDPGLQTDVRGWAVMKYDGHSLGWAKMLPGRMNNYYPKEMRILK